MNGREKTSLEREQYPETDIHKFFDWDVYDQNDQRVGKVVCMWTNPSTGDLDFLGVKTTWLMGKTHVVPTQGAQANHARKIIRLPYHEDVIKNAPSYDPDEDLDQAKVREVYDYYRGKGGNIPEFQAAGTEAETPPRAIEGEEEVRMPLREEELKVGKRQVTTGGIRLRKIVRTEVVQQPVELQREEIEVEHVPASELTEREHEPAGKAFEGEEIFIPLRREEAVVEKEAHTREEVRARKTRETERQTVSGEVRKEEAQIEDERRGER